MSEEKWQNQYMHLVTTLPGTIISSSERASTNDDLVPVLEKIAASGPCLIELGAGSGMHILEVAKRNPSTLCVAAEIRFKRAFRMAEKAIQKGLSNVLVARTDAKDLLPLLPPSSVRGFYVNYPDPWDKRRWHKNRLLNSSTLDAMWRALTDDGYFRYKTDHHEYFSATRALLKPDAWKIVVESRNLLDPESGVDSIPTEFELLFRSQKLPLCYLEALKRSF